MTDLKNRTKWILIAIMAIVLVLFGLYRYYVYVQADTWKEEDAAILRAKQEAGLVKTTGTSKSVWDNVCWVVEGKNANGEDIMVWLEKDKKPHVELMKNGYSKDKMEQTLEQTMPDADIVRLLPGVYEGQYVWQLYYKQKDHYYYQFFRFTDGQPVSDEFTIPNR